MREIEFIATGIKHNQPKLSPLAQAVRLSIVGLGLAHGATQAATIEVTSHLDDNGEACTLRQAIVSLNDADLQGGCLIDSGSFGSNDLIIFSNSLLSNSIFLTPQNPLSSYGFDSQLNIDSGNDITIVASNVDGGITVDADRITFSRIFEVESATLSIDNMTITGAITSADGGGFLVSDSTLILNNSIVSNNRVFRQDPASYSGGIFAENSTLRLTNSTISDNTPSALFGRNIELEIINSTYSNNSSSVVDSNVSVSDSRFDSSVLNVFGGDINVYNSDFYLSESSELRVSGDLNVSDSRGYVVRTSLGGVSASNSEINVIESTISGSFRLNDSTLDLSNSTVSNAYAFEGGFVYARSSTINIENCTVTDTTSLFNGGSIDARDSNFTLSNTIIANGNIINNTVFDDLFLLDGGSFISDSASILEGGGGLGGSRDSDPGLLPLANNGGPTQTHALAPDSIARDTGDLNTCTVTDQLGRVRDDGDGLCDVGAFESIVGGVSNERDTSVVLPSLYLLLDEDEGN